MEIIEQQAALHNAEKIVKVSLEFGTLTAVMPEAIRFAFEVLSKDTVAENAELDITIIPITIWCTACGRRHVLEAYRPTCPLCDSAGVQIVEGRDEMRIVSLEIDDGRK
jgi:hydrogenase nickel incorporation protein HypA/HybF